MPGGTAFYFSAALQNLQVNHRLITKLATDDLHLLDQLDRSRVEVIESPTSHFYENIYRDYSNHREQKAHSLAKPFKLADVPHINATYFHLGPLSKRDISLKFMRHLKNYGKLSLDAQGLLRKIVDEQVIPAKWKKKEKGLPLLSVIKVNEFEAETLTGQSDPENAALELSQYGIEEVVLTLGSKGSLICFNEKIYHIPAYQPPAIIDATGCGDTYMAGYLYQRSKGKSVTAAGKFGAAMATLKMENFGPFTGVEGDVRSIIES